MTHGDHLQLRSCLSTSGFKRFHVEGVVLITCDNAVVNSLFLLKLEPRHQVRIVFSVRRQHDVPFLPRHPVSDLINGVGGIASKDNFIGCGSV